MNTLRPGQAERIAHLFRRGYSLDLVSELGLHYGWTRVQARNVVAAQGWALDYSGRLQLQFVRGQKPAWPTLATADPERLLNAGIDHENADVRRAALAAQKAVEKLRKTMLAYEEAQALSVSSAMQQAAAEVAVKTLSSLLGGTPAPVEPQRDLRAS